MASVTALKTKPVPSSELDRDDEGPVHEPLEGDAHAEIRMLYRESTETVRFIKSHQWKTVGATLLAYLGLVFVADVATADQVMANALMGITIMLACAVIFTLVVYQFWMINEFTKIDAMERHLSPAFARIRALKSRREGNAHRYLLLFFMATVVVLGAVVVHLALARMVGI